MFTGYDYEAKQYINFATDRMELTMERNKLWFNSRLIQNLNTYINEEQISGSISRLNDEVKQIESVSGPSRRTVKLRNEISRLEEKLAYSREQISLRSRTYQEKS